VKDRNHLGDLFVDWTKILKYILNRFEAVDRIHMAQDRVQWRLF